MAQGVKIIRFNGAQWEKAISHSRIEAGVIGWLVERGFPCCVWLYRYNEHVAAKNINIAKIGDRK